MDRLFFLKINAIKRGWSEGFCICDIVTGNESICCPGWKPGDDDCGFFFFFGTSNDFEQFGSSEVFTLVN